MRRIREAGKMTAIVSLSHRQTRFNICTTCDTIQIQPQTVDRSDVISILRPDTRKDKFLMQPQFNRVPYFPQNLDGFAPWVAKHGLFAPYGECQCGCGQKVSLAPHGRKDKGFTKDHPIRFIHGHSRRIRYPATPPKLCECGCGLPAPIAKKTIKSAGYVTGQPKRFIQGHDGKLRKHQINPDVIGYCECGCGQRTNLALYNHATKGWVAGKPLRYIKGHQHTYARIEDAFWNHVSRGDSDSCWNWCAPIGEGGYGRLNFRGEFYMAHRFSYVLHGGEILDGMLVCHKCDNPSCCNPNHLFPGTHQDNAQDMANKGRHRSMIGKSSHAPTLEASDVIRIRKLHADGLSPIKISAMYGRGVSTIYAIVNRETWKDVP